MPRRGRFHDEAGENPEELRTTLMKPRAYQQELLEESMQHNLIIALDTGSGKTHIAVLRMKHESERDSKKVVLPCSRIMLSSNVCVTAVRSPGSWHLQLLW